MNRRTRLLVLAPALAAALSLGTPGPGAFARAPAPVAVPSPAACSVTGVRPDGTATLSGRGFQPGTAVLALGDSPTERFTVKADGSFSMPKTANAPYTVRQGNTDTRCTGATGSAPVGGNPYKAGVREGWDAARRDCDVRAPASGNGPFTEGWKRGAAVAREAFC
ncbi:hypothetical protein ACFWAO_28865 [Streptomyces sp. NPDC059981]|uniref:hypothetical protein n=1 Tax=Streptomyces sp. NPDC059981 TaxID=3347023 RepID=UPI0036B23FE2